MNSFLVGFSSPLSELALWKVYILKECTIKTTYAGVSRPSARASLRMDISSTSTCQDPRSTSLDGIEVILLIDIKIVDKLQYFVFAGNPDHYVSRYEQSKDHRFRTRVRKQIRTSWQAARRIEQLQHQPSSLSLKLGLAKNEIQAWSSESGSELYDLKHFNGPFLQNPRMKEQKNKCLIICLYI